MTTGALYQDVGNLQTTWIGSSCSWSHGVQFTFTPSETNHLDEVIAVDTQCDSNGVPNHGCNVMESRFRSDTNGVATFSTIG